MAFNTGKERSLTDAALAQVDITPELKERAAATVWRLVSDPEEREILLEMLGLPTPPDAA